MRAASYVCELRPALNVPNVQNHADGWHASAQNSIVSETHPPSLGALLNLGPFPELWIFQRNRPYLCLEV